MSDVQQRLAAMRRPEAVVSLATDVAKQLRALETAGEEAKKQLIRFNAVLDYLVSMAGEADPEESHLGGFILDDISVDFSVSKGRIQIEAIDFETDHPDPRPAHHAPATDGAGTSLRQALVTRLISLAACSDSASTGFAGGEETSFTPEREHGLTVQTIEEGGVFFVADAVTAERAAASKSPDTVDRSRLMMALTERAPAIAFADLGFAPYPVGDSANDAPRVADIWWSNAPGLRLDRAGENGFADGADLAHARRNLGAVTKIDPPSDVLLYRRGRRSDHDVGATTPSWMLAAGHVQTVQGTPHNA